MISIWKKNMKENFRISHFCDVFAKKIMTKQRDETENFPVLAKMISLWAEIEGVGTPKMIKS